MEKVTQNEYNCGNIYSYYVQLTTGPRQVSMFNNSKVICISEGYKFSDNDSSLSKDIATQYTKRSSTFLEDLDVEASFFLYDKILGKTIAYRDPTAVFNIFYLSESKKNVVISNDIRCVLPFSNTTLSTIGTSFYLKYGWLYGPYTLFENIYAILPFTALVLYMKDIRKYSKLMSRIVYFWKPKIRDDYIKQSVEEKAQIFSTILLNNIQHHSMDNNAVFFSGGLDSAIVASALSTLDTNTTAYKWNIKNLAPYELPLVNKYFEDVNIGNKFLNIDVHVEEYFDEYSKAIINSPISPVYTDYITQETVRMMKRDLGSNTMIFNGELVLLDAGFSEINNSTRNIRRELYLNPKYPKFIDKRSKLIGNIFARGSDILDKIILDHLIGAGIPKPISYALGSLSSFGNINRYYSGLMLGKRGFPGWATYFPRWLNSQGANHLKVRVTDDFVTPLFDGLDLDHPALTLNYFKYQMYNICSNQSMYTNAAKLGGLNQSLPFNNKQMLEFTANLPLHLWKDKKIERISAKNNFKMPELVSNYPKDQKESIPPYMSMYSKKFFSEAKQLISNPTFINHLDNSHINGSYLEQWVAKSKEDIKTFSPEILNLQLIVNHYFGA